MIIAVDMNAYCPDGSNGGVSPLTLTILEKLSQRENITLYLLTNSSNHESLSYLDCESIHRVCMDIVLHRLNPYHSSINNSINYKLKALINKFNIINRYYSVKYPGITVVNLAEILHAKVDILYCPYTAVNYYDKRIQTVITLHDIQHKYYPDFFAEEELNCREKFYLNIQKIKPAIISISDFTKKSFIQHYNFPEEKIKTIHTAIQDRLKMFTPQEDDILLEKMHLEKNEYLFYPANFWPHKNHNRLFQAFSKLIECEEYNHLRLALSGFNVPEDNEYEKFAKSYNIYDNVSFLGYVSDAEMAALFRNCRMLVFPSLFEGFGIPVTEAMSFGVPIACSDTTALPEIGGDCVFYFNPENSDDIYKTIVYVLEHPEVAKEKTAKYHEHLAEFSFDEYIEQIVILFNKLSNNK